jgi:hypothetical protein
MGSMKLRITVAVFTGILALVGATHAAQKGKPRSVARVYVFTQQAKPG